MKHVIVIPDGAADESLAELDGRTPLQAASLPVLTELAKRGRLGTARSIPPEMPAHSESALLSLLGYDPRQFAVARGPLEALGRGLPVDAHDAVFRCSLVTVVDGSLRDHTAGLVTSREARALLDELNADASEEALRLHAGAGHRNLCIWRGGAAAAAQVRTTQPTDVLDQPVEAHLPRGHGAEPLLRLMERATKLAEHDINVVRGDLGENPANAIWLWGNGPRPELPGFAQRYGVRGAVVCGIDLLRGLGRLLGLEVLEADGATGLIETNYPAKAQAAIDALERVDLVVVHVQAPDTASHLGRTADKVRALERIDAEIVAPLARRLQQEEAWRLLVMPAHATPICTRRHNPGGTIFLIAGHDIESHRGERFDEASAADGELHLEQACDLMEYFLRR